MRLLLACAEICRAAASVMLIGAPQHKSICAACAEIARLRKILRERRRAWMTALKFAPLCRELPSHGLVIF